jgi:hypothetical protein
MNLVNRVNCCQMRFFLAQNTLEMCRSQVPASFLSKEGILLLKLREIQDLSSKVSVHSRTNLIVRSHSPVVEMAVNLAENMDN